MTDKERTDLNSVLKEFERPLQFEAPLLPGPAALPCSSPTVAALEPKRRPEPKPVCEACPHSMWFASAAHLKCYCRVMHVVTWNSEEPAPILSCDGILLSSE